MRRLKQSRIIVDGAKFDGAYFQITVFLVLKGNQATERIYAESCLLNCLTSVSNKSTDHVTKGNNKITNPYCTGTPVVLIEATNVMLCENLCTVKDAFIEVLGKSQSRFVMQT